jgi:hypothetical protein
MFEAGKSQEIGLNLLAQGRQEESTSGFHTFFDFGWPGHKNF